MKKFKDTRVGHSVRVLSDEESAEMSSKELRKYLIGALVASGVFIIATTVGVLGFNEWRGMEQSVEEAASGVEAVEKGIEINDEGASGGTEAIETETPVPYTLTADSRDVTHALIQHYGLPEEFNFTVTESKVDGEFIRHTIRAPYSKKEFHVWESDGVITQDDFLSTEEPYIGWSATMSEWGYGEVDVKYPIDTYIVPQKDSGGSIDALLFKQQDRADLEITVNAHSVSLNKFVTDLESFLKSEKVGS